MGLSSMRSFRTDDGLTVTYEVRGRGSPTLVFIHGWAGSRATFRTTVELLDLTATRAIAFDLRGHGDSGCGTGSFDHQRIAGDVLSLADEEDVDDFVVVGFSVGAQLAQWISAEAPRRVAGQILISGWPATPVPLAPGMVQEWCGLAGKADALTDLFRAQTTNPVNEETLRELGSEAAKATRSALEGMLVACASASFADRLPTLSTPTLIIGGLHDETMPGPVLRDAVAAPLTHGRIALLDANHVIPLERPHELAALLEAFLAGLGH
jgi:non-heme chloroperoxidase